MAYAPRHSVPQRIVSLISSGTEILYGLGLGPQVVAVSHECDFPRDALAKPRATFSHIDSSASSAAIDAQVRELTATGKSLYEVDGPLLLQLKPDLIVTQAQCDVCAVRFQDVIDFVRREPALRGTPVFSLNPQHLEDVMKDVLRLGEITGRENAANEYVAIMRERIAAVRARTGVLPVERRRRTACIEWIDPPMMAGNWTPELIEFAGGMQTFTRAGHHSVYTPWADVVRFDPEVIVVMPCGFDLERTVVEANRLREFPHWRELCAVREGRVFAVDGNALLNRSGPRLVESLELLAELVHPELHGIAIDCPGEDPWWRRI
jgi:iron complex transport system substrate-binding protein